MGHVVISGAGPAGAVLGYLLAERGVAVTLLERHHDFSREFRGEDMPPSGIDVFRQMGLSEQLASIPNREISYTDVYRNGRKRFTIPWVTDDEDPYSAAHFIPQPELLEMVTHEAARFPSFTLRRGAIVREPIVEDDRVVGVEAEIDGARERIDADLVVGCDGRTSVLRRKAGLEARQAGYEESFDVVWCRTPFTQPAEAAGECRLYLAQGRIMLVLPTPGGQLQLGTIIEKGSFGDLRRLGTDGWIDRLATFVSDDLITSLREHAAELGPTLLGVVCFDLAQWYRPGLLLIGDAAHPMSPAGGQGLAQALRDAVVACNELTGALSAAVIDPAAVDDGARSVQTTRDSEVRAIQAHQRKVPLVLFQRTWYSNLAFGVVGPALGKVAPRLLTKAMHAASAPFRTGIADVRLQPPPPVGAADGV